jgi:hypothetical protein
LAAEVITFLSELFTGVRKIARFLEKTLPIEEIHRRRRLRGDVTRRLDTCSLRLGGCLFSSSGIYLDFAGVCSPFMNDVQLDSHLHLANLHF